MGAVNLCMDAVNSYVLYMGAVDSYMGAVN